MDRIVLEDELAELEQIHQRLDEQINRGYTNYMDDASLGKMKQEKLVIKREIKNIKTKLIVINA
jgi:hypothetical protein